MVTCTNPCSSGVRVNLILGTPRINPTGPIEYNTVVNISIDVTDQSAIVGGHVYIDVVDMSSGICLYTDGFWLDRGTSDVVTFPVTMPNSDISLRISASSLVAPFYFRCEDVKEFTIKQKLVRFDCVGTGTDKRCVGPVKDGAFADQIACEASGCKPAVTTYTYVCPGKGLVCKPVTDGSGYSTQQACVDAGCKLPVADGGISAWFNKKTCITPTTCIPNWGLVGVGAVFFMMMSKR